jgi:hypothetical protein
VALKAPETALAARACRRCNCSNVLWVYGVFRVFQLAFDHAEHAPSRFYHFGA